MNHHDFITFSTKGEVDMINITDQVSRIVQDSGIKQGTVTIFAPGATAAISAIEFEPGLLQDFPEALERLFPKAMEYQHHILWHDGNGHSHVRATFLKPDMTVPIIDGSLTLGTVNGLSIQANSQMDVPISWHASPGNHTISVEINPTQKSLEMNSTNNIFAKGEYLFVEETKSEGSSDESDLTSMLLVAVVVAIILGIIALGAFISGGKKKQNIQSPPPSPR